MSLSEEVARYPSCRHWKGLHDLRISNGKCGAGHDPRVITGGSPVGWLIRCPCVGGRLSEATCAGFSALTSAEIAAHKAETEAAFEQFRSTLPLITEIKNSCKPGEAGQRECPKCKGVLRFSRSGINGHLRMKCSTDNCFMLME